MNLPSFFRILDLIEQKKEPTGRDRRWRDRMGRLLRKRRDLQRKLWANCSTTTQLLACFALVPVTEVPIELATDEYFPAEDLPSLDSPPPDT